MRGSARASVVLLTLLGLGCSSGSQKLYVVNDTGQPVEIEVAGKAMPVPAGEFTPYVDLKLTKGTYLRATRSGQQIDAVDLPPVPEDEHVVWIVSGSDHVHLADYQALATIGRKETRLVGFSPSEIALADPVPPARFVTIPARAVIVGPSAPMPAGGQVTLGGRPLPILRVERVPTDVADVRTFLAQKASKELSTKPK